MSCNGCRILRKGCSETCILRPCLQWIQSPESQGHATVFVAKFFGRAGLMSFLSNVPDSHRPALFQSLLYEACGRTVNPVSGAVGLLWSGNWHLCQGAVETVLRGGTLRPISPDFFLFNTNTTSPAALATATATAPAPAPALPIDDNKYLSSLSKLQQQQPPITPITTNKEERDLDLEQDQDQDRDLDLADDDDDEDDQNSGTTTAISTADNHHIYRYHQHQHQHQPIPPTLLNLFF